MRLFIILALFTMPLTAAQMYSTDSNALPGKTVSSASLFNDSALPKSNELTKQTSKTTRNFIKHTQSPHKTKKVRVFTGSKNAQGMQLLSVLLMLKEKKK